MDMSTNISISIHSFYKLQMKKSTVSLAPMLDVTNKYFRYLCRQLSKDVELWTEMIVAETIIHNKDVIQQSSFEEPIVLQLGGSDLAQMKEAALFASSIGFTKINLNCGCPSDRVAGRGCFGAALMRNASLVKQLVHSIGLSGATPSIKCRLGIDDLDSQEFIKGFIKESKEAPCSRQIIHSRKCVTGLNPKQNRSIPPIMQDRTISLKDEKDFQDLTFDINGEIKQQNDIIEQNRKGFNTAMIGRAIMNNPFFLYHYDKYQSQCKDNEMITTFNCELQKERFHDEDSIFDILKQFADKSKEMRRMEKELTSKCDSLSVTLKPVQQIFQGIQGNTIWRQTLSKQMEGKNKLLQDEIEAISEAYNLLKEFNPNCDSMLKLRLFMKQVCKIDDFKEKNYNDVMLQRNRSNDAYKEHEHKENNIVKNNNVDE